TPLRADRRALGARPRVDPLDPGAESRVRAAERLPLVEDAMEELVVFRITPARELEERERRAVRSRELAHQEVAAGEHRLEAVERSAKLCARGSDQLAVGLVCEELALDRVRPSLPDTVEPVDEELELGT